MHALLLVQIDEALGGAVAELDLVQCVQSLAVLHEKGVESATLNELHDEHDRLLPSSTPTGTHSGHSQPVEVDDVWILVGAHDAGLVAEGGDLLLLYAVPPCTPSGGAEVRELSESRT